MTGPLPPDVLAAVDRMDRRPDVREAIRAHLIRQRDVPEGWVALLDGRVVRIGEAPE